jgi:hypothetical protein
VQVTVAQSPLSQSSLTTYQRPGTPANDGGTSAPKAAAAPIAAPAPATDTVSVHPAAEAQALVAARQTVAPAAQLPEVFAEIWKDGMRIGSIYTDGQAVMSPGAAAIVGGGSSTLPYLRAQEVSRIAGGEVRYVDLHALHVAQTRNQLRSAYGV